MELNSLPNIIILGIYLVVGCVGNIFVLFIYRFRMRNTLDNRIYVPCLALADMLSALLCSVFAIYALLFPVAYSNEVICKMSWYTMTWSSFVAASILSMIAIQRYTKICRPLSKSVLTGREISAIVGLYTCALMFDIPILFMSGIITLDSGNGTQTFCERVGGSFRNGSKQKFATIYTVIEVLTLPLVFCSITYCYYQVSYTLYRRMKSKSTNFGKILKTHEETSATVLSIEHPLPNMDTLRTKGHERTVYPRQEHTNIKVKRKRNKSALFTKGNKLSTITDSGLSASSGENTMANADEVQDDAQTSHVSEQTEEDNTNLFLMTEKKSEKMTDNAQNAHNIHSQTSQNEININTIMPRITKIATIRYFFKQHRYTAIFITITLTFFVTYTPRAILMILETVDSNFWTRFQNKSTLQLMIFLNRLHIMNCIVNPFLYSVFDEKFKVEVKKLVKCKSVLKKGRILPQK